MEEVSEISHSHSPSSRSIDLPELVTDLQNAVKIKRGKETIIFRTDKTEDKKMLLLAFKKVAEELMNKKRKEMLSEAEARKGDVSLSCVLSGRTYSGANDRAKLS